MSATVPALKNNHRQDGWLAVAIAATVVETVFFALRAVGRWYGNTRWWLDDYLVALGYAACLSLNVVGIAITTGTLDGQRTQDVLATDPDDVVLFLKLQIPLAITYACAVVIPKMAIVALFHRVFIQKSFRVVCWTVQIFLAAYLVSNLVAILALCTPFSANWQLPGTLKAGEHCGNVTALYKAVSVPNIVTDLIIIVMPIPVVWRLQKTTLEKFTMLLTFCLQVVGLALSIARLVAFFAVFSNSDVLWTSAYIGIFTTIEPASYFLVSCMLTFRQLKHGPCCARTRKQKERKTDMEQQREEQTVRTGSDRTTLIKVNSALDLNAAIGLTEQVPVEIGERPQAYVDGQGSTHTEMIEDSAVTQTRESLNRASNTTRYTSFTTATHDSTENEYTQEAENRGINPGRGIIVKQEVIISNS